MKTVFLPLKTPSDFSFAFKQIENEMRKKKINEDIILLLLALRDKIILKEEKTHEIILTYKNFSNAKNFSEAIEAINELDRLILNKGTKIDKYA